MFSMRMSLIMYGFVKRAEFIPLSAYRFLADVVVKGELSIP